MRKIPYLVLLALILVSVVQPVTLLVGCSQPTPTPMPMPAPTPTPTPMPAPQPETTPAHLPGPPARPTKNVLTSVYLLSSNDGWAVGEGGNIIRWDGHSWSSVPSPTEDFLMSVHMLSPNEGWVVGFPHEPIGFAVGADQGGTIMRWDGHSWVTVPSPTTGSLFSIYMLSSSQGWAVGYNGTIIRWDGSSWSTIPSPKPHNLMSVHALSPTDAWAVGQWGTILRWNGSSWSMVPCPTKSSLTSIQMLSPDEGWAVGCGGMILKWDGNSWSTVPSPTEQPLYSIHMLSSSNGWAVGEDGTMIQWNGTSWSTVPSPARRFLLSVCMVSPTVGWAVGDSGAIHAIPPEPNHPPVVQNPRVEGQTNPNELTTLNPLFIWDYSDPDDHAQERFWIQVGTSENDNSLWDYVSPDWQDLEGEVYHEPFDDLDNFGWWHPGAASMEIDPPGQLHLEDPGGIGSGGGLQEGVAPKDFTFETKIYFDRIDEGTAFFHLISSTEAQFGVAFQGKEDGLFIQTEHIQVPNWDNWDLISPRIVKHGEDAEWQTWRFVITGDDWGTGSCDIYLTDSEHTDELIAEDVTCLVDAVYVDHPNFISYETAWGASGHIELHIDYVKIVSNNSGTKITDSSTSVTYDGSKLAPGVTYHWRVKCYDGENWSKWASGTLKIQ